MPTSAACALARRARLAPGRPPEARTRLTPAPLPQAPLDAAQRLACLRLIRSDNIGPVTFRELINHFGSAAAALDAVPDLAKRGGRQIRVQSIADAERELAAAARIGARLVAIGEPEDPASIPPVAGAPP